MSTNIEKITVSGLHGNRTIAASLTDNTLILIGENGSGKTTFLRIVYYFLAGKWLSLLSLGFEYISVTIDGTEHRVTHESITKAISRNERGFLADLPSSMRRNLMEIIANQGFHGISDELAIYSSRHGLPIDMLINQLELFGDENVKGAGKGLQEVARAVKNAVNSQVLYLPTYRRIERELSSIFEGVDQDDLKKGKRRPNVQETSDSYVELVEFGMKDVAKAVDANLSGLRDFARENLTSLAYRNLGDVVDREYENVTMEKIASVSEATIRSVLDRVPESILTALHKEHLLTGINKARTTSLPDEHSKIICNYFLNLLDFQNLLQEREKAISAFCEICSQYILDKKFVYDRAQFGFFIIPTDDRQKQQTIPLSDLSSGEKQIVSLFSHLYLSGKNRFFVLIDEPELSLSVSWQRRFLIDIKNGGFCAGLIAVTHSPFIYDNELRKYAHSLGEFFIR